MTPPKPPSIVGFDFVPRTRTVFGAGSVDRLGGLVRELGVRAALVVTMQELVAARHVERARRSLESAGVSVRVYDDVSENPTASAVDRCAAFARESGIDGIVGLGGGSSLDTAKACNFLLTSGGTLQDYRGYGKATKPMLPLVAVPTTAGTGSEAQSYALISDDETHAKMACGDPKAAPAVALLDPELTLSQPRSVTASAGMDALVHSVETAVTRTRNELSSLYAREAFRAAVHALPRLLEQPDDLEARARMQLGALFAGTAIELSMLGAAHAAANPLTAHHGAVHGEAVGMMLPAVVRLNGEDPGVREVYRDLLAGAGLVPRELDPASAPEALAARIEALLVVAGMPVSPAQLGVSAGDVPRLAREAAEQWTAKHNPRALDAADFEALYARTGAGKELPTS